jgi:hypothetical protein
MENNKNNKEISVGAETPDRESIQGGISISEQDKKILEDYAKYNEYVRGPLKKLL